MKLATTCRTILVGLALLGLGGCDAPRDAQDSEAAALQTTLATHRERQLQRLHTYALAGEFPHNIASPDAIHMFRDADGRYCAVANLVHLDGLDDLVAATVRDHNDLAIHDVHNGPMMTWILASGFTQEELERIQFPSRPLRVQFEPPPAPPKRARPVDEVAARSARPALRTTVAALDEDAMKAVVRAELAKVEAELRSQTDTSLALARRRYARPAPQRVASR